MLTISYMVLPVVLSRSQGFTTLVFLALPNDANISLFCLLCYVECCLECYVVLWGGHSVVVNDMLPFSAGDNMLSNRSADDMTACLDWQQSRRQRDSTAPRCRPFVVRNHRASSPPCSALSLCEHTYHIGLS